MPLTKSYITDEAGQITEEAVDYEMEGMDKTL